MIQLPVTVIVPAKQEARNIKACLESLTWANQVIVVDSQSTDGTVDIARQMGATVVQFEYDGGWPKKKNWAIQNLDIDNDWIFIVDADERVTEPLRDEIAHSIKNPNFDGYYVRWKFVFFGRWMKHCWNHGWMLRLFRRGTGEYEDLGMRDEGGWDNEVHENIIVQGKTGRLSSYLVHESNSSLEFWIKKQNEFSTWNAERRLRSIEADVDLFDVWSGDPLKRRRVLKSFFVKLPFKPVIVFIYLYFVRMGFLDGVAGYYFCALRASHELNTNAKIYEKRTLLEKANKPGLTEPR